MLSIDLHFILTFHGSIAQQALIGWKDPGRSYDYHNLVRLFVASSLIRYAIAHYFVLDQIFDLPWKGMPRKRDEAIQSEKHRALRETRPIFSIFKYYPPPWKTKVE
jgi:hypothetical protein